MRSPLTLLVNLMIDFVVVVVVLLLKEPGVAENT